MVTDQPPPLSTERLAEIGALMRRWATERMVLPGGTTAPSTSVADAGLELVAALAERTRERDALREGIRELVASVDAPGSFSSGPTQEQHDRTLAALAALRVLAARAAEGDGEVRHV